MTMHLRKWKESEFKEIKELFNKYESVAVLDLRNTPASIVQRVRKGLIPNAVVKISKTKIVLKALGDSRIKDSKLKDYVKGSVGLIFTNMNAFELFAYLKRSKQPASAKPGMIAPEDIVVPACDTGLPPGPALTTFKNAGVKVKMGATISIAEDQTVTKKGEPIKAEVCSVLGALNLKPFKVGTNAAAIYEKGELFLPLVLDIDTDQYFNNFMKAYNTAFNLSVEVAYPTKQNIEVLVGKAFKEAKGVALEGNFLTKYTTEDIIAKAVRIANGIKPLIKEH
ncbi:MAG: 50S ribosomal protein L10 [Candidatus Diapherotrites archaeon CG08_land_8_20_14_0_20_34_12]|nr:MAG: 50S ribosomal protein L10 [Candidatus Diapherotrites archaeon CG08_land_8_20_14_0_20_34_12]